MKPNDIARVQYYLRRTFDNNRLAVIPPSRAGGPIEVRIGDEFLGVVHRDEEDDEISYSLHIVILDDDLPAASPIDSE